MTDERPRARLAVAPGSLAAGPREITGTDHHYLFRVRRLPEGALVELFDGAGLRARGRVRVVERDRAVVDLEPPEPAPVEAPLAITALVSLIKGERMEWCVQKLVELGAARVVPVRAARSVVRLDGARAEARQKRLQSIAADAARQCGRAVVPEVAPIADLAPAVAEAAGAELCILLDETEPERGLAALVRPPLASAAVLIGPEGSLTDEERAVAARAGFEAAGLGPRILRAETAAIAAVAALQVLAGDLAAPAAGI